MAYINKWQVLKNDQWRYVLNECDIFSTSWHFVDLMPQKMVDEMLGITSEAKSKLRVQYRNTYCCPACGASGFERDTYYCPTCGEQMIFDE